MRIDRHLLLAVLATAGCARPPPCVQHEVAADTASDTIASAAPVTTASVAAAGAASPVSETCCHPYAHPCTPAGRVAGAPEMSEATVEALGPLARSAAEAIDTRRYEQLAELVHPDRGLAVQERFHLSVNEVRALDLSRELHDFSWGGICPNGEETTDTACPHELLTFAGFLEHMTTRLGPMRSLPTPLTITSEVAFGRMSVGDVCNLCVYERRLASAYPGVPYVAYQRRVEFIDGCYWEGNQAVIFQFDRDGNGRWWLIGLLRAYGEG